jgi:multicomponent Na+:H+ antiporter subunit B
LLLCAYFALLGHVAPGGGFAAGVIAASGVLYIAVAYGMEPLRKRLPHAALAAAERGALLLLLLLAIVPVAFGRIPLSDLLPKGTPGHWLSGGSILAYNVLIAGKVFLGAWVVIAAFAQHRGEL